MNIEKFLIPNIPETAFYIENFITEEEEKRCLMEIEKTPKPKWTQLSHRRLINYGGIPHPKGMIAEEIPNWLKKFTNKINDLGIFDIDHLANHVLINEYLPGQGIMPHADGPLFYPIISTISCGSHTILELFKNNSNEDLNDKVPSFKLLLQPRSLLILKKSLYTNYMHSISEMDADVLCDLVSNLNNCSNQYKIGDKIDRTTRISLTIRHVPKTTKLKLNFLTKS